MAQIEPLIDDEAALAYADQIVNGLKGLQHLAEVVRYIRGMRKDAAVLEETLADLKGKIAATQADHARSVSLFEAEQARQTEAIGQMRSDFKDASEARTAARGEVRLLEAEIEAGQAKATALGTEIESRTQQVSQLAALETDLKLKVSELKTVREQELAAMGARLKELAKG